MDPEVIIPIVSVLAVFGCPVAILYVLRHFRLKERELQLEAGGYPDERYAKLEERLDRIEKSLETIGRNMNALPPGDAPPPQLPPAQKRNETTS